MKEKRVFQPAMPQLPSEDATFSDGVLCSARFGDIYFSVEDGLAETRHVFINGTGLADRLLGHEPIIIAETGFGTGLNFLAVCATVLQTKSRSKINFISVEGNPPGKDIVAQALSGFAELESLRTELLRQWPRRWLGVHHLVFFGGQIELHLHYGNAEQVLPTLDFSADVWFLDGFSPAKNPELWSAEIFQQIARLSAHQARLATFTVAAGVRAGLSEAGFSVAKAQGFGRKRDMLTARYERGFRPRIQARPQTVLIIGAGIAGCAVASSLHDLGFDVTVIDAGAAPGAGASGNPAGIVVPFLAVGDMLSARLSISCLADTRSFLEAHALIVSDGVISLDHDERKSSRQEKLARQGFPTDLAIYKTKTELSALCGLSLQRSGLYFETGAVIRPQQLADYLAAGARRIYDAPACSISGQVGDWVVQGINGQKFTAEYLVLCAGADLPHLLEAVGQNPCPFQVTSGQISDLPPDTGLARATMALNYSGYLTPVVDGRQYLGAGFDPLARTDVTETGHLRNLELMPVELRHLAQNYQDWQGRTSRRLACPDRLPLAGPLAPGVSVVGALGARGLTLARLIGKSVARQIASRPPVLSYQLMQALDPRRFF